SVLWQMGKKAPQNLPGRSRLAGDDGLIGGASLKGPIASKPVPTREQIKKARKRRRPTQGSAFFYIEAGIRTYPHFSLPQANTFLSDPPTIKRFSTP
ncbi:hypothetical protein, partial [Pseudomonas gingeri]|uniref:hypothetical protein n=1 Tax=Pseudomonas gingeri TaxID=117681 RepID=UPI001C42E638